MREIKFRAVYKGELLNRVCVSFNLYEELTKPCNHDEAEFGKGAIFEQFTGVHDKNGKEIYEGDIVSCPMSNSRGKEKAFIYPIVFTADDDLCNDDPSFTYRWWGNNIKVGEYRNLPRLKECEVIGNIHDNPELLEAIK